MVNAQWDLAALQGVGEVEVSGGIVCRVAAEDNQQIDLAAVHVGDEIFDGFGLIDRVRIGWVRVENGLADVAKLGIDYVHERMHHRWLMVADDYQGLTLMEIEID